jgi:ornithine cyclodeaminase
MNGAYLTALRTGAAGGLATELLAVEDASVLTVFGAGPQARTQIEAVRAVRPIREIRLASRPTEGARILADELEGVDAQVFEDPEKAVLGAQVIVTATDSRKPVFPGGAIGEGVHVNAIGAFTPEMAEVDGDLISRAKVVVDLRATVMAEAGDLVQAIEGGAFFLESIHAELGEVVNGERTGRESPREITLFKSVGNAAQDVAVAGRILDAAVGQDVGTLLEI